MSKRLFFPAVLAVCLVSQCPAGVIVDSAVRTVELDVNGAGGTEAFFGTSGTHNRSFSVGVPFVFDAGLASLQSDLQATMFSGAGRAETHVASGSSGDSASSIDLTFTLTDTYRYVLTGNLEARGDFLSPAYGEAQFKLGPLGTPTVWQASGTSGGPVSLASTGILGPGAYELFGSATSGAPDGFANIEATFDFNLSFQQVSNTVPEPSTMSIFSLLIGVSLLRRRRCLSRFKRPTLVSRL